jgi:thiamine biosynthesis lipoprotein
LEVGEGWARLAAGHAVDLGGIGKGWLADRLCERFDNGLVNLGGDLRARGEGPDGCGWTVGLCDARCVVITDGGVATSGVAGRRWMGGHHLIDPRTGASVATDVSAVSVAAADALTAEILAKCAVMVGVDRARGWVGSRGAIRCALVLAKPVGAEVR